MFRRLVLVWMSAAESALADACCFAGGPVPDRGLVLGRGVASVLGLSSLVVLGFARFVLVPLTRWTERGNMHM